jgi:NADH dehydrogenase
MLGIWPTYSYRGLVDSVGSIIGAKRPILNLPGWLAWIAGQIVGKMYGDVTITMDEIRGLTSDLLYVDSSPLGSTRLSEWATDHRNTLGRRYTSEMARRTDRRNAYRSN